MTAIALGAVVGLLVADAVRRSTARLRWRWRVPVPRSRRRRWAAVVGVVIAAVVLPPAAPLAVLAWWTRPRVRVHRAERLRRRQVRHALPDLVDLLILASSAGLSLPVAHPRVALHVPAPVGPALAAAHEATVGGRPRADAVLAELAPLGERAHALAQVLVDHLRYGVPLLPGLERTGLELRLDRRRRAELDARRVPVRLLAPLVTCVLPAFALLTVVPLLAASLEALPT
jgi:tight adherence protein C